MTIKWVWVPFILASMSALARAQGPDEFAVTWIDRPWEYRYLIYTKHAYSWSLSQKFFAEDVATDPQKAVKFGEPIAVHYKPTLTLALPEELERHQLHVLRLDVDRNRTILQPNLKGDHLRPRLNRLQSIVLTPVDDKPSYVVRFGKFFMGALGASDSRYLPTMCSSLHGDSMPMNDIGRYKPKDTPGMDGYFGCREWAAQLYDSERPYIDVTSYDMVEDDERPKLRGKYRMKAENHIRPFIGFSRYDSPIKPVIGNHKGTWFCITDCPKGDAPGPIADMKTWVTRSGWAMPQKPKNLREFMDTPVEAGDFQD